MARDQIGVMPQDRWEALLERAAEEFAEHGFEQASLNRIVQARSMSKSSFYHYVESKDALFDTTLTYFGTALVAELGLPSPAALRTDFWREIDALMRRLGEVGARRPVYLLIGRMSYLRGEPAGSTSAPGRVTAAVDTWVRRTLATGRRSGAVRRDLPPDLQVRATLALLRAVDEWTLDQPARGSRATAGLAERQLTALRGLLADPAYRGGTDQDE